MCAGSADFVWNKYNKIFKLAIIVETFFTTKPNWNSFSVSFSFNAHHYVTSTLNI